MAGASVKWTEKARIYGNRKQKNMSLFEKGLAIRNDRTRNNPLGRGILKPDIHILPGKMEPKCPGWFTLHAKKDYFS